jgi:hypothetical protein
MGYPAVPLKNFLKNAKNYEWNWDR